MRTNTTLWKLCSLTAMAALLGACLAPDSDPVRTEEDDGELWDEGPPDPTEDEDFESSAEGLSVNFQLPFPCGQVWEGQSRTKHSPQNSLDFNRPDDTGDAVLAAAAGKVTRVGNEGDDSYGRWIEIQHANGYTTRYAHLSTQSVSVGQQVAQGKKIGTVGNTGGSSGAHLHYEQRRDGIPQRPVFNGANSFFFGSKNYTSKNSCGGGGGGGSAVTATVNTNGADLTVRSSPSTSAKAVGSVNDGAKVTIKCQKKGASVSGTYGTTTLWDFIGTGYISDAYVATGSDGQVAPTCQ